MIGGKVYLGEEMFNTFDKLGYNDTGFPVEESWGGWKDSLREGTHWTHPVYGPKRIHLA